MSPDNQNSNTQSTAQSNPVQPAQVQPASSASTSVTPQTEAPGAQAQPAAPAQQVVSQTPTQPQTAAPQAPTPAQTLASAPAAQPQTAQPTGSNCKCPPINPADWDKKKTQINKSFYKTYSPRLLYYPFSFVIDIYRAQKEATSKGYKPVENGMILDTGGMFWANVMVEVTGANTKDSKVVSLEGKEVYTKVSRSEWKNIKNDIMELEKELGKKPGQLYIWWTSCPACMAQREAKAVLIAL